MTMADSTTFDQVVVTSVGAPAPAPAPTKKPRPTSMVKTAAGIVGWFSLISVGIAAIVPISAFAAQEIQNRVLLHADAAGVKQALEQDWSHSTSPTYVETISELAMQLPVPDVESAYVAASRATELDTSRAYAWAQLAYLEPRRASGNVNEAAINALTRSMDACPLCSEELIAWRFNFVLTNWKAMPEALRQRAFEQADMLRWVGQHAEFLAEMRVKARQNGIPFDKYRAAVKTPARTWDIDPSAVAPQAVAPSAMAEQAQPGQPS